MTVIARGRTSLYRVIARGRTSLYRVIARAGIPLYRVIARAGIPAPAPPRPFHSPLVSLRPLALSWFWPGLAWSGTCRGLARPSTRRGLDRLGLVCHFSGPGSAGHLSGLRLGLVWHFTEDVITREAKSPTPATSWNEKCSLRFSMGKGGIEQT